MIDAILEGHSRVPRKQRHTAKRVFERLKDEYGFDGWSGCWRATVTPRVQPSSVTGYMTTWTFLVGNMYTSLDILSGGSR